MTKEEDNLRSYVIEYMNRSLALNNSFVENNCKIDYFELLDELSLVYFENHEDIRIVMPNIFNTLKRINVKKCTKYMYFGDLVSKVSDSCFMYNRELEKVVFNGDIVLESNAFSCCESLYEISSKSIKTIDKYAFHRCFSLTKINLENTIIISSFAFNDCSSLEKVNLSRCEYLKDSSFIACRNLKTVILKEKFKNEIYKKFPLCSNLKEIFYV